MKRHRIPSSPRTRRIGLGLALVKIDKMMEALHLACAALNASQPPIMDFVEQRDAVEAFQTALNAACA